MRYFVQIAYNGTRYSGWQVQPNCITIQQELNQVLSTILQQVIRILGCGRTDAGVHASEYYFHFDTDRSLPSSFIYRANKMLKKDIVLYRFFEVSPCKSARFNATRRSYKYRMVGRKSPLFQEIVWYNPHFQHIDFKLLQSSASLLLKYQEFYPFCKSNSDSKHYKCDLKKAIWSIQDDNYWVFEVQSNRFLRGMIRLIVGMCVQVGIGKISLETVKQHLDEQITIPHVYSAPANGLFLSKVEYDFELI